MRKILFFTFIILASGFFVWQGLLIAKASECVSSLDLDDNLITTNLRLCENTVYNLIDDEAVPGNPQSGDGVIQIINQENLTFDCNGAVLSGNGRANSVAIMVFNNRNITVKNCKINNFTYGISFDSSEGVTVKNNIIGNIVATDPLPPDVNSGRSFGIGLRQTSNSSVFKNRITANTPRSGGNGIFVREDSQGNSIYLNRVEGCEFNGLIAEHEGTDHNDFYKNISIGSFSNFSVGRGASHNIFKNNISLNAVQIGIGIGCDVCPEINANNVFMNNTILNANNVGIRLQADSLNSRFINNIIAYSARGITDEGSVGTFLSHNSLYHNRFYDYSGINSEPTDLHVDCRLNSNYSLPESSQCIGVGDTDADGDGRDWRTDVDDQDIYGSRLDIGAVAYDDSPSFQIAYPPDFNDVAEYAELGEILYFPNARDDNDCLMPYDDMMITKDTKLCPGRHDLIDEGQRGVIIIAGHDLTLDCNGAALAGSYLVDDTAIYNNGYDRVTITNCNLTGWFRGIHVAGESGVDVISDNIISYNNVRDMIDLDAIPNVGPLALGIYVQNCVGCLIHHNFTSNINDGNGVLVDRSSRDVQIYNNISANNGRHGFMIELPDAHNCELHHNLTYGNSWGYAADWGAHDNYYHNNISYQDKEEGFKFGHGNPGPAEHELSRDNLVKNNTIIASSSTSGISLHRDSRNTLIRNNIIYGSEHGHGIRKEAEEASWLEISYNNIYIENGNAYQGMADQTGINGNISADLSFQDIHDYLGTDNLLWTSDDGLRLQVNSPSIDAGDPSDEHSNEPMPNGGRINQGAYGNTTEAERSIFPLCIEPYVGMIITEDTNLCAGTWELPLENNIQAAIKIEASNVRVVCEPNTVLQGNGKGIGIFSSGQEGLNIENCEINNFNEGLLFRLTSKSNLRNLIISQNDKGLKFAQNSHDNTLQNVSFLDNAQYDLGIFRSMATSFNSPTEKIRKVLGWLIEY